MSLRTQWRSMQRCQGELRFRTCDRQHRSGASGRVLHGPHVAVKAALSSDPRGTATINKPQKLFFLVFPHTGQQRKTCLNIFDFNKCRQT